MEEKTISIIKTGLSFGNLLERRSTKRIIIHHSAGADVPTATIHTWHRKQGWSGISYHFVIRQNGDIEEGRPLNTIGAHAGSAGNSDSIGICLTGNFAESTPSEQPLDSWGNLVQYLRKHYQANLQLLRHRDVAVTQCPGDLFPWPEDKWHSYKSPNDLDDEAGKTQTWKNELVDEALRRKLISEHHDPDGTASIWFVLAVGFNILKEIDGKLK